MENEIVFYTNAPESYDGFGTRTLEVTTYIDQRKTPVRKIAVPERAVVWQKNRNASGMNVTIEADEFDNVKDIYFERQSEIKEVNPFVKPEDLKSPEAEENKTGRIEMLDDLHELDMWVKFPDNRFYRKFNLPNDNRIREFTDNGIKEVIEEKGDRFFVTLSVFDGSEAERVSDLYMHMYPVEGMVLGKKETETIIKTTNISLQIANYKNPYEVNRAIERLLDEKGDEPESYTPDEIAFIGNYSGYGGLEKYGKFSDEELKGLLYEFFTPDEVVKKMWGLAYKHGYGMIGDNSVFEPSVGVGAFLKYAPDDVFVAGNEINRYSAMICHILYPNAEIRLMPFEKNFIFNNLSVRDKVDNLPILQNRKFSLVIGNPPYGKIGGIHFAMGEDKYSRAQNFVEYFIFRGLDLLVKGGLLIYIVGAEQYNGGSLFLDGGMTPVKQAIYDKAELVDAYRLPTKIFERTGVSSEIVIFRKR